jgi:uncharacterized protein with von Willebrand factor type A (vWA) domain
MASWIRRSFTSPGLTQIPPGPHLRAVQAKYGGGTVILCIDVSGSMDGTPLKEAVRGARTFVTEALEAHYKVGVLLWNHEVVDFEEPAEDGKRALRLLDRANAGGGNDLLVTLERCHKVLQRGKDDPDRVVAIFGDGDISPKNEVLKKVARMKAENIRFVTRGLGYAAAQEFAEISSEEDTQVEVGGVDDLAESIAGMATALKGRGRRKK